MKELIAAYYNIFKINKLISLFVFFVQIIGCVLILLVSTALVSFSGGGNTITITNDSGTDFANFEDCLEKVRTDKSVINIVSRLENNIYATTYQTSSCNLGKTYDFSGTDNIIVLSNEFGEAFSVNDTIELYGKEYSIVDFNSLGFSEVPLFSLPQSADVFKIEIYLSVNKYQKQKIYSQCYNLFGSENSIEMSPNINVFQVLKSEIVLFLLIILISLLNALTLLICYKFYFDKIYRINTLCFALGIKLWQLRTAILAICAAISTAIFALGTGLYYIIGAISFSKIENAFQMLVYHLKIGDIIVNLLIYLAAILIVSTLYFASKKRYKGVVRVND